LFARGKSVKESHRAIFLKNTHFKHFGHAIDTEFFREFNLDLFSFACVQFFDDSLAKQNIPQSFVGQDGRMYGQSII
jgi:hypothetical protein